MSHKLKAREGQDLRRRLGRSRSAAPDYPSSLHGAFFFEGFPGADGAPPRPRAAAQTGSNFYDTQKNQPEIRPS